VTKISSLNDIIYDFICPTVYMQGQEVTIISNPYSLSMWQTVAITICVVFIQLAIMSLYDMIILKLDKPRWLQ
jgi:hypothetical protein